MFHRQTSKQKKQYGEKIFHDLWRLYLVRFNYRAQAIHTNKSVVNVDEVIRSNYLNFLIICFALRLRGLEVLFVFKQLLICGNLLFFLLSCIKVIIRATTIQKTTTIGTPMINNITQSAAMFVLGD